MSRIERRRALAFCKGNTRLSGGALHRAKQDRHLVGGTSLITRPAFRALSFCADTFPGAFTGTFRAIQLLPFFFYPWPEKVMLIFNVVYEEVATDGRDIVFQNFLQEKTSNTSQTCQVT